MTTNTWIQAASKGTFSVTPLGRPIYALWAFREPGEETLGVAERAAVLKKHGYAGFSGFTDQVDDARAYEKEQLLVPGLYFAPDASSYEKGSWESMVAPLMKHYSHDSDIGAVWLDIHSDDPEKRRGAAIQIIQDAAAWAQASGKKVHLYPHVGCQFPNACQAVEYLKWAECEHLGIVFTLYHELLSGSEQRLEATLVETMPYVRFFAMSGGVKADDSPYVWKLTTLDRREYDVHPVLKALHESVRERAIPIGFYSQHFGGTTDDNLERYMRTWNELTSLLLGEIGI